ncbi:hypothetical protein K438DRAFT_1783349 [Mycena galopus ATCC 62051]|nr:hypothetical protein K438DRAFT_1783349 [Mycena galopus ATCC 62051]
MLIGTGFAYKLLAKIGPRDLAELLARKQCIRSVPLDTRTSLNKRGLLVRSVDTAFAMRLIQRSLASNFPVKPISAKSHVLLHQDPPSSRFHQESWYQNSRRTPGDAKPHWRALGANTSSYSLPPRQSPENIKGSESIDLLSLRRNEIQ